LPQAYFSVFLLQDPLYLRRLVSFYKDGMTRSFSMDKKLPASVLSARPALPRNVKVLGIASLLNDIASEMVFPLLPSFLLTLQPGALAFLGAGRKNAGSQPGRKRAQGSGLWLVQLRHRHRDLAFKFDIWRFLPGVWSLGGFQLGRRPGTGSGASLVDDTGSGVTLS
jgi:hypothetical protein